MKYTWDMKQELSTKYAMLNKSEKKKNLKETTNMNKREGSL